MTETYKAPRLFALPVKYAKEKYPVDSLSGAHIKKQDIGDGWFSGMFIYAVEQGPVFVFVGNAGTIGACLNRERLSDCTMQDLRAVYKHRTGKDAEKVWIKDTIIERLTA